MMISYKEKKYVSILLLISENNVTLIPTVLPSYKYVYVEKNYNKNKMGYLYNSQ